MSPSATRVTILGTELVTFFLVTAFTTYFISHAGALHFGEKDSPPAFFPVIAYDGHREKPVAKGYFVVPWNEWEALAAKRPGASLLLPEPTGNLEIAGSKVLFAAAPDGDGRQAVELTWTGGNSEQQVRYRAQARAIEPRFYRTVTTNTFFMGAGIGFITGVFTGRVMRRRWLG